jgi:hypothetical protein
MKGGMFGREQSFNWRKQRHGGPILVTTQLEVAKSRLKMASTFLFSRRTKFCVANFVISYLINSEAIAP